MAAVMEYSSGMPETCSGLAVFVNARGAFPTVPPLLVVCSPGAEGVRRPPFPTHRPGGVATTSFCDMNDTSPEAAAVLKAAILRCDPVERMRQALTHSDAMLELGLTRLRERYPDRSTLDLAEILRAQGFPHGDPALGDLSGR